MDIFDEDAIEMISKELTVYDGFFYDLINCKNFIDMIDQFHIKNIHHVKRNDDYYCGIRANNFCVKVGFLDCDPYHIFIIVEGNHKGNFYIKVMKIPYGNIVRFLTGREK